MIEPGRTYSTTSAYRYGFNGKEQDSILGGGTGIDYNYGFRIYDARVGRFLSVDPLTRQFAMITPYQFSSNSPIANVDLDGKEATPSISYEIFKAAGITKATGDEIAANTFTAIKDAGRIGQDALIVTGGILTVAASGGAPLAIALGVVGTGGGLAKFYFDVQGEHEKSEATPTTITGVVMVSANYMVGKAVFSEKFQATVSFAEGVATLDLENLKNPDMLKQASESVNLLTLTIDAASIPANLKGLLSTADGKSVLPSQSQQTTPSPVDKTYVKPTVIPTPKKAPQKKAAPKPIIKGGQNG